MEGAVAHKKQEDGKARPRRLLAKFTGVALIGFGLSALVLHFGIEAGLRPWAARLIALVCAMNLTFLINGRVVFATLTRKRFFAQWGGYLANSAFGNSCNYWVFVTLESLHRPVISDPYVALLAGSVTAWAINFMGARFLVFGDHGRRFAKRCREKLVSPRTHPLDRASAEPGSSRQ